MTKSPARKKSKHKRRRLLGSGLSTSERFNALGKYKNGEFFQLIYCMMQPHADEWGIISANTFGFKALILPGSSRKDEIFIESLQAMHEVGLGILYLYQQKPYFEIWDFDGAQSGWIRNDRRGQGLVPRYSPDNNELEMLPGLTGKNPEEPGNTVKALPCFALLSNKDKTLEQDSKIAPTKSKKFKKPTVGELANYAQSIGYDLDPGAFIDHYEGKGWMVGKSPMKDWQACVRTWKRKDSKVGVGKGEKLLAEAKEDSRHCSALYEQDYQFYKAALKDHPKEWEELKRFWREKWPPEEEEEMVDSLKVRELLKGLGEAKSFPTVRGGGAMTKRTCQVCGESYTDGTTLESYKSGRKVDLCLGCFMYAPREKIKELLEEKK